MNAPASETIRRAVNSRSTPRRPSESTLTPIAAPWEMVISVTL